MKASNYSNRSQLEVSCCPRRAGCPLALLCGSQLPDGRYLARIGTSWATPEEDVAAFEQALAR